ncbi:ribosomal RNA small subunit methyltransferase h [Plakobranchus ocellatus]|uniref:Ribosomal RNA small subunit methyltransferase h n=1 Tax=Plakobranchus ocellatus TaxID=259542 RepID=A0AAV3ZQD4_9GAST|nr:ribosomal RNA small subunit methyltransferase h [Plakobranchus ocellatus]
MTEDGFYPLGTDQGILKQLYARAEFTACPKEVMKVKDIPDHDMSQLSDHLQLVSPQEAAKDSSGVCARRNVELYEVPLCEKENKVQFHMSF